MSDTIVAQVTSPGRSGVGIIRVSGPKVREIAQAIIGTVPKPRYAHYSSFYDQHGQIIDVGLVLFFPGPHSFTGEDVLEFQGHGGSVVLNQLLQQIINLNVRMARPGEFSERAFLNDKIDLTQAEAIADLIDANTTQAAQAAIRSLQGEFSHKIKDLVDNLIELRIFIEGAIDFPDEEIEFLNNFHITDKLKALLSSIELIQLSAKQGVLLRDGLNIVIAGKPNAGKSSLLNCLSGHDSAIVTDIPGTTRDLLRVSINLDGIPLHIIDTAGLQETADRVELEGIKRARNAIKNADHILLVVDSQTVKEIKPIQLWHEFFEHLPEQHNITIILNKADLTQTSPDLIQQDHFVIIKLSAKTGDGIDLLRNHLKSCAGYQSGTEGSFSARSRHLDALARAHFTINHGLVQLETNCSSELLAEELKQAQYMLSEITGDFSSDDLLGKIFASFCIGK